MEALQVRDVARDVEAHDLTAAIVQDQVAEHHAFKDEATLRRSVAFADDVLIRLEGFDGQGQATQGLLLLVRESGEGLQLLDQPVDLLRIVHGVLPCGAGGSASNSQASAPVMEQPMLPLR
jgi:hypothetical protein